VRTNLTWCTRASGSRKENVMNRQQHTAKWSRVALALAGALALGSLGASAARAEGENPCPSSAEAPYRMGLKALTGPLGAELAVQLTVADGSACPLPTVLKKIQLKTFDADGILVSTRNVVDRPAPGGAATLELGQVPRNRRVEADVLVQSGEPERTFVVRGFTKTLLRPDLVVTGLTAPKQSLVGAPVTVTAVIEELNGDVGATANVGLSAVPGSAEPVEVPRGGEVTVTFENVAFGTAVPVDLKVEVKGAAPLETDDTNNARSARIDVTEHALPTPKNVLFPSLLGYGAQFNNHLYAPISTAKIPAGQYPDIEEKVKALEPQLVRIFYNDNWEENLDRTHPEFAENYASFVQVVQLAQDAGATIEISYQNLANAKNAPEASMAKFADALEDLVVNHHLTNVRWTTIGNEPNSPCTRPPAQGGCPDPNQVTLEQYAALYRELHRQLVERGLRGQISLMGGGFIESAGLRSHYNWVTWVAANLGDILDGYAEHVYWWYYSPGRLEYRLRDTYHLMKTILPPEQRKPTYMMEFGVRGLNNCGTKPTFTNLYYGDADCTEIWRTNIAAFQQLWFNIDSAQLGVAGTSKWDAYWAVYDRNSLNQQLYWMTGPPAENYPLTPTYNAMSLYFHVTEPGWQIIGVVPWESDDWTAEKPGYNVQNGAGSDDQPEKELVAYAGPSGELTVLGLDTHGRALNTASSDPASSYSIGGLPANATFALALWNATGDGTNSIAGTVTTNDAGVARFEVPLQAAFALTTLPVS
jgi:hypothetical protein